MAAGVAADHVDVALVTDRGLGTSNSAVAQGGLQLPESGDAALARFRADILNSGGSGIDEARLDRFVREVRPTIELLTSWGLALDRTPDGSLVRRIAGGLSEPRIVTSGDRIGSSLLKVLRSRLIDASVDLSLQSRVTDIELTSGGFRLLLADGAVVEAIAVVLAIGGGAFEAAVRHRCPDLESCEPEHRSVRVGQTARRRRSRHRSVPVSAIRDRAPGQGCDRQVCAGECRRIGGIGRRRLRCRRGSTRR